jgi:hypothetical protein
MCIVCVEFQQGKLTSNEASRNFGELYDGNDLEHYERFIRLLFEKIIEEDDEIKV